MTVTHRKRQHQPDEISSGSWLQTGLIVWDSPLLTHAAINEPGLQIECDSCMCDLTHSIRIKCADPACEMGDGVDICPACFCAGKEFKRHRRGHDYRVVVCRRDWYCFDYAKPLMYCLSRNCTRILYLPMTGAQTSESSSTRHLLR